MQIDQNEMPIHVALDHFSIVSISSSFCCKFDGVFFYSVGLFSFGKYAAVLFVWARFYCACCGQTNNKKTTKKMLNKTNKIRESNINACLT